MAEGLLGKFKMMIGVEDAEEEEEELKVVAPDTDAFAACSSKRKQKISVSFIRRQKQHFRTA